MLCQTDNIPKLVQVNPSTLDATHVEMLVFKGKPDYYVNSSALVQIRDSAYYYFYSLRVLTNKFCSLRDC